MKVALLLILQFLIITAFTQVQRAWVTTIGARTVEDRAADAVTDSSGNLYLVGTIGRYPLSEMFFVKIDARGTQLWRRTWQSPNNYQQLYEATTVDLDPSGNLIVTAIVGEQGGIFEKILLQKYTPGGTLMWSKMEGVSGRNGLVARQTVIDKTGNIFVGGVYVKGWISGVVRQQRHAGKNAFRNVGVSRSFPRQNFNQFRIA